MLTFRLALLMPLLAGALCAGPALAAVKTHTKFDKHGLPLRAAPRVPGKEWETEMTTLGAKLHEGMNSDEIVKMFLKVQNSKHARPAVFDSRTIDDFTVTSTKKRVYLLVAYFRLDSVPTYHQAILAFESPQKDFTGGHAKLINAVVLFNPPIPSLREKLMHTVAKRSDINKAIPYKFGHSF